MSVLKCVAGRVARDSIVAAWCVCVCVCVCLNVLYVHVHVSSYASSNVLLLLFIIESNLNGGPCGSEV